MVFVSILLKNAEVEAERIEKERNESILFHLYTLDEYCKKNRPEYFGFENSKEKLFFDNIYKGELSSSLYLSIATTTTEISKWIVRNTSLKYMQYYPQAKAVLAESDTSIFLCFRGTQMDGKEDIITDINLISIDQFGGKVHQGFYNRANSVRKEILTSYDKAKKSGKRLIFCGHSLGGAVATMSTLILLFNGYYEHDVDVYFIVFGNALCLSKEVVDYCKNKYNFNKYG